MNDKTQDWSISRSGRKPPNRRTVQLPGKLLLALIGLCEIERHALLAALLEDFGMDEVVKMGDLQAWQEAVAARFDVKGDLSASPSTETPDRYWNCRVIEFPSEDETWYAIHEVHYAYGKPIGYTAQPASPGWSSSDDPGGALRQLKRFGEALQKPFLKVSDFEGAGVRAELLDKLGQMIEQSGGARDMPALAAWLDDWLVEPQPELNGKTAAEALCSDSGRRQVETLLERMRGGLVG